MKLSDLLPLNTLSGEFSSNVLKYQDVCRLAYDAILAFEMRQMHFFDPIAGDCACQVRAIIFASLINDTDIDNSISYFKLLIQEHISLISDIMKNHVDKEILLKEYLIQHALNLEISENITIIILSYIISLVKVPETYMSEEGILSYRTKNLTNINGHPRLKGTFLNQTIILAQKRLTKLSVGYIQKLTVDYKEYKKYLDDSFIRYDHLNRSLFPCYPQTQVILEHLINRKIPIVLRVGMFVAHEFTPYNSFELVFNDCESNKNAAFVLAGKSVNKTQICPDKLRAKLLNYGIKDILLSGLAIHPQYPYGEDWRPSDLEYKNYVEQALDLGTCRENPTTCAIDHIYCEIFSKVCPSPFMNVFMRAESLNLG